MSLPYAKPALRLPFSPTFFPLHFFLRLFSTIVLLLSYAPFPLPNAPNHSAMEPGLGVAIGARSHHIWRHASRLNLARRSEGLGPPQNGDTASSSSSPQQQHTLSPPANSKTAAGRGTNSSPHQQQQSDAATAKAEFELLLLALKSDDFGKELHLRHTPLGTLGQMQLATTLMQHNRTLLLLDLSNTQLTSDAVTGSALPQKQQLALPPGPGPGGRGGLRGLAGFVAKHPVLQTLKLSDNPLLGDDAASALASALDPSPPPLGHVTTTGVIVSPPATAAASSSVSSSSSMHQGQLPSPAQLATLELARCGIKKRGMTALATALYRNSCLTCLDLDANTAGPDGGAAFGNALRTNGALKSLQLTGNGLVRFDAAAQQHSFQVKRSLYIPETRKYKKGKGKGQTFVHCWGVLESCTLFLPTNSSRQKHFHYYRQSTPSRKHFASTSAFRRLASETMRCAVETSTGEAERTGQLWWGSLLL